MAFAVGNHTLKFGTIVCCTALCAVYVFANDNIVIGSSIFVADLELTFNGLFGLAVA